MLFLSIAVLLCAIPVAYVSIGRLSGVMNVGTPLLASTFLGWSGEERFGQIALTKERDLVVTGSTGSRDFPVTVGAHDESYNGGGKDVFVVKMGGSQLVGGEDTSIDGDEGNGPLIPEFPPASIVLGMTLFTLHLECGRQKT